MSQGISDMCRDHRCLTTCQKQHRQNEPAGQVDVSTRVEVHVIGDPRHMCRDYRCLTTCQKQHRQNESPGQVDIPGQVDVSPPSKTTQTEYQLVR